MGHYMKILLGFIVVLLSNCGSDGVLETASNNIFEQPRVSTSVLNDGSIVRTEAVGLQKTGIVSLEGYYRGEEANIILVSQNAEQAKEIMTTTTNWTTTASSSDETNNSYVMEQVAYAADGKPIFLYVVGQCLSSDCENASNSIMVHNNDESLIAGGDPIKQLPSGTYTYVGSAIISEADAPEDGFFSMTANFNNAKADITAGTNTYFFSASDLTINTVTGRFNDPNGTIGKNSGSSKVVKVSGYFSGSNGEGVHGIVYSDLNKSSNLIGSFLGKSSELISTLSTESAAAGPVCRNVWVTYSPEEACGVDFGPFSLQDYYGSAALPSCNWGGYEQICE